MKSERDPGDEPVVVRLGPRQRAILRTVVESVDEVGDDADDAAVRRRFPAASEDEAIANEFAEMTSDDLRTAHAGDADTLTRVLERQSGPDWVMSSSEADACARAVGAARIAMAARLGAFDDARRRIPVSQRAAVDYLAYVQDRIVNALLSQMPDSTQEG